MSLVLTPTKKKQIKDLIFKKADAFGYGSCSRSDSGVFMDKLVENAEIGGSLKEYMSKEKIRTYIKDTVLNAYTKELTKKTLSTLAANEVIRQEYSVQASIIQEGKGKEAGISVLRSADGQIYVISCGTILKWETALRKALELSARQPDLTVDGVTPSICLHLALGRMNITDSEKKFITTALESISVKARFCGG
jgi:hypothetical protein